jgi:tetratricopeptide (TPR) repeat protein
VENNKLQEIRTQLSAAWRQLQIAERADRAADLDDPTAGGDNRVLAPIVRNQQSGEEQAVAVSEPIERMSGKNLLDLARRSITRVADSKDRFSEITAPISKLNLPQVQVNPWSAFWAILATMVGGTGIAGYLLMIAVPPTPNCQKISPISSDSERLYCAQIGAETREIPKLRAAVELVQGWSEHHPLYREGQRLLKTWSLDLMRAGRKQLNEGSIDRAIATLKIVPPSSPVYTEVQVAIDKWTQQAHNSANIDGRFDLAMQKGDWNEAFVILQTVQQMRGNYWNTYKHEKMSAKLAIERAGWDKLQEAKDALSGKDFSNYIVGAKRPDLDKNKTDKKEQVEEPLPTTPQPILKAMELANQIDKRTYVYQEGQHLRSRWSKQLVNLSVAAYKQQQFNEAIELAQQVPNDVGSYQEAQDWVKLNRAHVSAGQRHMLAVMDAISQVKKIPKTSPIYSLARVRKSNWQAMLKQQTQFQWAKSLASFQQPATLALAIDTAKQIPATSDVGQTMQSEVATWNRQIQTIDNRVTLAKARQIANKGDSLVNLKAAARLAGKIRKDQPLGAEATEVVGEWNHKIQTIEDTPILVRAQALATSGNLAQAVALATKIAPGRALYGTAQAQVRYWSLELMEIADRRTLDRAIAIYRQGKIAAGIELASTIGRRSPVYGDARPYIANWRMLLSTSASRR